MISVRLQGKPFNITVIQVYAPTSNTEEAEVERFYEDLQDLLKLTPKRCPVHYIQYCGQESVRRNGVAIMVNKRVQNAVLGCNLKNDRMISVHFQGKPFSITVIQVYVPTSNEEV